MKKLWAIALTHADLASRLGSRQSPRKIKRPTSPWPSYYGDLTLQSATSLAVRFFRLSNP